MAWHETGTEKERLRFFNDWKNRKYSMTELCIKYGISRKTGYKFVNRICVEGEKAVHDRPRTKFTYPNITKYEVVEELLEAKRRHINWGPAKIRDYLKINNPHLVLPATSTVGSIFRQHGLVKPRKKRLQIPAYTQPLSHAQENNSVWSVDFKGQFKLGNGELCYPLTISDNFSRYLICCESLANPTLEGSRRVFEKIFEIYGLPDAIRSDNGQPFAGTGILGLTQLSVWWLKLGIKHERIKPGHPEQNGRHERMHRTLKQATVMPPSFDHGSQQQCFDAFRLEYNTERPHQALRGLRPADIYKSSKNKLPSTIPEMMYSREYKVRRVRGNGEMKQFGRNYYISRAFAHQRLGLETIGAGKVLVHFGSQKICIIDADKDKVDKI
jgi:putative transposase